MDTRMHFVDLESFREMLHISPRVPGQSFAELPFEEEILEFLRFLGHSAQIKTLTDVNVNKLYQPWRSFAAVINKCLARKSTGFDSLRHETHISQQGGSGIDEGTGSKPGVPDVPSDDSEEELLWNSSDDEDIDEQTKGIDESEETTEKEEESFDPIPRTPEESEDDGNGEEDQGLRMSEEERMQEEDKAEELYCDVDINQGRGLQVSQDIEDSHVTLTLTHSDGQQESLSTSSFVTNLLNPINDPCMEFIFTTGSSTITPIPSPKSTITPSIISTFTTAGQLPIPPTSIPSLDLQNLPTFASVFRFEDRVKLLEFNFSNILGEQRNLYKALVEAYDVDKTILDTYGELAILKRRRGEDDDQEGPSAGSDRRSKRQREGGEHASANTPSEQATESAGRSITGTQSRQLSASESAFTEEPVQTTCQMEEPSHLPRRPPTPDRDWNKTLPAAQGNGQSWISALAKKIDARSSFNELLDTPIDFSNFIMNRLGVDTLTPDLLAGLTYELIRGSCNSLTELEYHLEEVYKATTDQLDWVNPKGQQYPHNLLLPLPLIPDNRGRRVILFEHFINNDLEYLQAKRQQFYGLAVNRESALDVYSKRRIIAVTELKIVEWHNYKHLDWISLSNLTVEERFAFNVSLRMFTRSIVIQRRVEDLQLGVESYQKRLNLKKLDMYRFDLKRREAYTAYSNPRGFIYQNKDKKNRLMRIDELHKFSDGTLNDVRNALDDRLKGIRM
nr:hypothetical protein [Tanacetum cinerariifolium]